MFLWASLFTFWAPISRLSNGEVRRDWMGLNQSLRSPPLTFVWSKESEVREEAGNPRCPHNRGQWLLDPRLRDQAKDCHWGREVSETRLWGHKHLSRKSPRYVSGGFSFGRSLGGSLSQTVPKAPHQLHSGQGKFYLEERKPATWHYTRGELQ